MHVDKDFLWAYTQGEGLVYETTFVSGDFHSYYLLYLETEKWNYTKKQHSCCKVSFYYLTTNITRGVFLNLRSLASSKDVKALDEEDYFL